MTFHGSMWLWSGATVGVYFLWRRFFLWAKKPWLHPVLWSTLLLVAAVEITGHPYETYKEDTAWIVWLLGPSVVALAAPIYRQRQLIAENFLPLFFSITFGIVFSVLSVYLTLKACGLEMKVILSLCLKSTTAPVAAEIAREAGGDPSLAGFGVMVAGILGAVLGPVVLLWAKVRDPRLQGLALGCTSHGVGTARAVELGPVQGAFASVGMSCTAILASLFCPVLFRYVLG